MAEKKAYKLQSYLITDEDTVGDEISPGEYETKDVTRTLKKEETKECSNEFLQGVYTIMLMYDEYQDQDPDDLPLVVIDALTDEKVEVVLESLDDVKLPAGAINQATMHQARAATVGDEGYDLFVNISDDAGTTHFRFGSPDFLLGMRYAQATYVGNEGDNNYDITELYLDGQQIDDVKAHVDGLAAGEKSKQ